MKTIMKIRPLNVLRRVSMRPPLVENKRSGGKLRPRRPVWPRPRSLPNVYRARAFQPEPGRKELVEPFSDRVRQMAADEAFKSGAMALFEEKYGDRVRVVSLAGFSKELCGGTHVASTGDIGLFKIIGESSVASGVRRIEALTGKAASAYSRHSDRLLQETARLLKDTPEALPQRVTKLIAENKALEKERRGVLPALALLLAAIVISTACTCHVRSGCVACRRMRAPACRYRCTQAPRPAARRVQFLKQQCHAARPCAADNRQLPRLQPWGWWR